MVTGLFGLAIAPVVLFLNRRQERNRGEEVSGLLNERDGPGSEPR